MSDSKIKLPPIKNKRKITIRLDESSENKEPFQILDLNKIIPNPDQPRTYFDQVALEALAKNIRLNGLLQPIIVKKIRYKNQYMIIAGERRYRALNIAYASSTSVEVACKVMGEDTTEDEIIAIGLFENLQREELGPLEIAEQLNNWSRIGKNGAGLTQMEIARKINKSKSYVNNLMGLVNLPKKIKEDLRMNPKLYPIHFLMKEAKKEFKQKRKLVMSSEDIAKAEIKAKTKIKAIKERQKNIKKINPNFVRKKDSEMYPIEIGKRRFSIMVNVVCDANNEEDAMQIAKMYIGGQREVKMIGKHTEKLTKIKKPKEKF